jgi:hypothetical protein
VNHRQVAQTLGTHHGAALFAGGLGRAARDRRAHDLAHRNRRGIALGGNDPAEDVALREDADDHLPAGDDHGPDALLVHRARGIEHRRVFRDAENVVPFPFEDPLHVRHGRFLSTVRCGTADQLYATGAETPV